MDLYHVTKCSLYFSSFLVCCLINLQKIVSFTLVLSIRIALSCFHFICIFSILRNSQLESVDVCLLLLA